MSKKWRTITLPETTISEIKENMKGFTSLSEFVRAAVRFYIDFRMNPMWKEEVLEEAPQVG